MILDALLYFTSTSGDNPTTGTQTSTNVLDLAGPSLPASASSPFALPGRDIGIGDDPAMKILVLVTVAFTGGTNIAVSFQGAPDNGSGSPGSYTTYVTGPTVVEASLVVGARLLDIDWPRPAPGVVPPRFVRLSWTSSGTHSAGTIIGTAVLDRHDQPLDSNAVLGGYPAGITISN